MKRIKKLCKELNITYLGNKLGHLWFNDNITQSTLMVKHLNQIEDKVIKSRKMFNK